MGTQEKYKKTKIKGRQKRGSKTERKIKDKKNNKCKHKRKGENKGKVKESNVQGKHKPTDSVNHKTLEYELGRRHWF